MDAVVLVGLIVGSVLLAIAAIGWLMKPKEFGVGGVTLIVAGAFLVTFSVWRNVTIEAGNGLTVRVERIERQVVQMAEASADVVEEVQQVAQRVDATGTQFVTLTNALYRREVITPTQRNSILRSLDDVPSGDPTRFQAFTERFRALPLR